MPDAGRRHEPERHPRHQLVARIVCLLLASSKELHRPSCDVTVRAAQCVIDRSSASDDSMRRRLLEATPVAWITRRPSGGKEQGAWAAADRGRACLAAQPPAAWICASAILISCSRRARAASSANSRRSSWASLRRWRACSTSISSTGIASSASTDAAARVDLGEAAADEDAPRSPGCPRRSRSRPAAAPT